MKNRLLSFLIVIFFSLKNIIIYPAITVTNLSPYSVRIIYFQDKAPFKNYTREITPIDPNTKKTDHILRFFPTGCIKRLIWLTNVSTEQEVNLGFNLGTKKIKAKIGGSVEFKNCPSGDVKWSIIKDANEIKFVQK